MGSLSVIIPALNEAKEIASCLQALKEERPDEILLVDGSSVDGTPGIAGAIGGVRVMSSRPGRAHQMNWGASAALGDAFLFLHTDARLPIGGIQEIQDALRDPRVIGGRFRVRFDEHSWGYRFTAFLTRFSFFSYGDQGFFVRKMVFQRLGGFSEKVLFEDIDFFKRLKKQGKTVILKSSVLTSARRFKKVGFLKQKMMNLVLATLCLLGFSPQALVRRWYPDVR